MIEIVVGSQNPTKLSAATWAAEEFLTEKFELTGIAVSSGVADQPKSDEDMIMGARNRALGVVSTLSGVDYAIGIEGGIKIINWNWFNLGWVCIIDLVNEREGFGCTAAHRVPDNVRNLMQRDGLELSDAITELYGTDTATDRDCSGIITGGLLSAGRLYKDGVMAAFADLQNSQD